VDEGDTVLAPEWSHMTRMAVWTPKEAGRAGGEDRLLLAVAGAMTCQYAVMMLAAVPNAPKIMNATLMGSVASVYLSGRLRRVSILVAN
jgi:hypothetical protein